jgi:hypothetical protein
MNEKEIETLFLVAVNTDGTFTAMLEHPETLPEFQRPATSFDVYQTSQQIVKEIDSQILVERLAGAMAALFMPPQEPTVAEKVSEKLKERKVKPEDNAPSE